MTEVQAVLEQVRSLRRAPFAEIGIAMRRIREADELALLAEERAQLQGSVKSVRCASAAARIAARGLLQGMGGQACALPRKPDRSPHWPAGFVGSLAHDPQYALAAIGRSSRFASIGVDIEPASAVPEELLEMIVTPRERSILAGDLIAARLLFCVKEAVFKACFPLDGAYLGNSQIEVDLKAGEAATATGRHLKVLTSRGSRLVAMTAILQ